MPPPPLEMIMMSSYSYVQFPQLHHGYSLPAQEGDTWMSDFNDRALERFDSWANNNAGSNGDFPVVENVLGFEPADRAAVENLEIKKAEDEFATHDNCCSVCLEGWEKGDDVKILPCGHYFHPACADEWLLTNRFCPLCRFELPPTSIPLLQE
ncbi:E3 ubiquitin-protein ligase RING1-like [Spinacia oleracea]|uniref:E3 ubiquitin-protein ligase RING1-like n=1 Tax=Spinacia oleracea TaxID=3562 RepID=A0A9R0JP72_SPIOL|nr:E3 ubiquitin-protein ligase RING1-like [Spinacia oleracea]